jgi:hypothetical protein
MGLRYRKTFKAGPFRATISKSGVSYSAGVKGARVTKLANGKVQKTVSIPGSGLSYTSTSGSTKKQQAKSQVAKPAIVKAPKPPKPAKPVKVKAPKPPKLAKPVKVKALKPAEPVRPITSAAPQQPRYIAPSSASGGGRSTVAAVPMWVPGQNKGYLGSFTLNPADVVIERPLLGRIAGYRSIAIPWREIVAVNFREPTPARNGYIHFVVGDNPQQLSAVGTYHAPITRARRPDLVMFTWQQRQRYQRLKGILSSAAMR